MKPATRWDYRTPPTSPTSCTSSDTKEATCASISAAIGASCATAPISSRTRAFRRRTGPGCCARFRNLKAIRSAVILVMPASRPQELHPLFELAFNTRDIEGIMALYEPTAVYVSGGNPAVGHSSIRQIYASILADTGLMTLATRAVVQSDEGLAVLCGAWSVGPPSKS